MLWRPRQRNCIGWDENISFIQLNHSALRFPLFPKHRQKMHSLIDCEIPREMFIVSLFSRWGHYLSIVLRNENCRFIQIEKSQCLYRSNVSPCTELGSGGNIKSYKNKAAENLCLSAESPIKILSISGAPFALDLHFCWADDSAHFFLARFIYKMNSRFACMRMAVAGANKLFSIVCNIFFLLFVVAASGHKS